jgi:hypothetical protein
MVFPIIRERFVECTVLLLGDIRRIARPNRLRLVELLVRLLDFLDFLCLFLLLLFILYLFNLRIFLLFLLFFVILNFLYHMLKRIQIKNYTEYKPSLPPSSRQVESGMR